MAIYRNIHINFCPPCLGVVDVGFFWVFGENWVGWPCGGWDGLGHVGAGWAGHEEAGSDGMNECRIFFKRKLKLI